MDEIEQFDDYDPESVIWTKAELFDEVEARKDDGDDVEALLPVTRHWYQTVGERKAVFLAEFAKSCLVGQSAHMAGVSRGTIWRWRKEDKKFKRDFERVREIAFSIVQDEMHRRAINGVERVNKYGTYREYSDTLAMFIAKAHRPHVYGDKMRAEISGPNGTPLQLDDSKLASKLNMIMQNALERKQKELEVLEAVASPVEDDDDDGTDLCY